MLIDIAKQLNAVEEDHPKTLQNSRLGTSLWYLCGHTVLHVTKISTGNHKAACSAKRPPLSLVWTRPIIRRWYIYCGIFAIQEELPKHLMELDHQPIIAGLSAWNVISTYPQAVLTAAATMNTYVCYRCVLSVCVPTQPYQTLSQGFILSQ